VGNSDFIRVAPDETTPEVSVTDWCGFPARVARCVTRGRAGALLDWPGDADAPPRALQEEYVEWRVVRASDGAIRRVELTSELGDYWSIFAGHEPQRALQTIAQFASENRVVAEQVYGDVDPRTAAPDELAAAFRRTMLAGPSQYNDGRRAITCVVHRSNTAVALLELAVAAGAVRQIVDALTERARCLTADECIALFRDASYRGGVFRESAVQARASDPVLVERISRLAFEGRLIAFDDPLGVYVAGVEHTRLRQPDGSVVCPDWFRFSRGAGAAHAPDGRARHQRMVLEVPESEGFAVSDLVDVATGQPITTGAQVADLVRIALYLRVSQPGRIDVGDCTPIELREPPGPADCRDVLDVDRRVASAAAP
jgi:hypothetical protein